MVLSNFSIPVLGMDVDGVVLASVIAEYLGVCIGLWLFAREV